MKVRKDTDFFNNYLRDAHRPELPVLTSSAVPQAGRQQREEVEHRPPPPVRRFSDLFSNNIFGLP